MVEHALHEMRLELRELRKQQRDLRRRVSALEALLQRAQRIGWMGVYFAGMAALMLANMKKEDIASIVIIVLKHFFPGT